jgi:hypothetical protein
MSESLFRDRLLDLHSVPQCGIWKSRPIWRIRPGVLGTERDGTAFGQLAHYTQLRS